MFYCIFKLKLLNGPPYVYSVRSKFPLIKLSSAAFFKGIEICKDNNKKKSLYFYLRASYMLLDVNNQFFFFENTLKLFHTDFVITLASIHRVNIRESERERERVNLLT